MSEPDEETIRRWQEYTHTPEAPTGPPSARDSAPAPAPLPPKPTLGSFPARRMAGLGLAILAALGAVALVTTWDFGNDTPGGSSQVRGAQPRSGGSANKPHNLVSVPNVSKGTGTYVSGVPADVGHLRNYMLDGRLGSSWQMLGAGTGREITFELDGTYRISEVGLATAGDRVRPLVRVTWSFKDQSVTQVQSLDVASGAVQRIRIPPVETDAVKLTLDEVGAAPTPAADFTGISEVQIIGY